VAIQLRVEDNSMREDDSFVAALSATPDDDALRLVYADWLEERGDARAEYLRLSCALATLPRRPTKKRKACEARFAELRASLDPAWQLSVGRTIDIIRNQIAIIRDSLDVPAGRPMRRGGFEALRVVLRAFPTLDNTTRKLVAQELARCGDWHLGYVDRAARESVRTGDPEELRLGFRAVALANARGDYREVLLTLSSLICTARKLRASADTLLQEAIVIFPRTTQKRLQSFFNRAASMSEWG
jgi:uncharacterized protein (TIGR02996 family)